MYMKIYFSSNNDHPGQMFEDFFRMALSRPVSVCLLVHIPHSSAVHTCVSDRTAACYTSSHSGTPGL